MYKIIILLISLCQTWLMASPADEFNATAQKLHLPSYLSNETWLNQKISICQFTPSGLDISVGAYKGILSEFDGDNEKRKFAFVSSPQNPDINLEVQKKYWPFSKQIGRKVPVVVIGNISNNTPDENIVILPASLKEPLSLFLKKDYHKTEMSLDDMLFSNNVFVASVAWKKYLKNNKIGPNVAFALINDVPRKSQAAVSYILLKEANWNILQYRKYIFFLTKNRNLYEGSVEAACSIYWFSESSIDNKKSILIVNELLKNPKGGDFITNRPDLLWITNIIQKIKYKK